MPPRFSDRAQSISAFVAHALVRAASPLMGTQAALQPIPQQKKQPNNRARHSRRHSLFANRECGMDLWHSLSVAGFSKSFDGWKRLHPPDPSTITAIRKISSLLTQQLPGNKPAHPRGHPLELPDSHSFQSLFSGPARSKIAKLPNEPNPANEHFPPLTTRPDQRKIIRRRKGE
jgi:hypothetical protein